MAYKAMEGVLKDFGLSDLYQVFEQEKITPDIVPKLSKIEFEALGIRDRQTIMDLRVKCTVFGPSRPPTVEGNLCRGAPKFQIPKRMLSDLIEDGFKVKEVASLLGVSERTIYRRLSEHDIKVRDFSDISEATLDENLICLCEQFPNCGERFLNEMLRQKGLVLQRSRVRESLHRVDYEGVKRRKKNGLSRRVYNVQGSNHLWHLDTHHKLVRWYFIVIGVIDGFSRLPVVLDCTTNNKAPTVLESFIKGVVEYGLPLRVRSDKGLENVLVADYILEKRGVDSGCMITGKSTHNQRIERLWRDVFTSVLSYFYELFYFMEEEGILDPLDDTHLACLHFVYLPRINERMKVWRKAWGNHRMRTTKTTPWKLWLSGQMNNPVGIDLSTEDMRFYGVEGDVEENENLNVPRQRPIFSAPEILPQNVIELINDTGNSDIYEDSTGINCYLNVLHIVQSL